MYKYFVWRALGVSGHVYPMLDGLEESADEKRRQVVKQRHKLNDEDQQLILKAAAEGKSLMFYLRDKYPYNEPVEAPYPKTVIETVVVYSSGQPAGQP